MVWYGGNDGGMLEAKKVGDLVRYDDGPTALMRITHVLDKGKNHRGIACEIRYYGRAFHSDDTCTGRYHGQCSEPSEADRAAWANAHDADDAWIRGCWSAAA